MDKNYVYDKIKESLEFHVTNNVLDVSSSMKTMQEVLTHLEMNISGFICQFTQWMCSIQHINIRVTHPNIVYAPILSWKAISPSSAQGCFPNNHTNRLSNHNCRPTPANPPW